MKTTTRTTFPDNPHELPVHEVKFDRGSFGLLIAVAVLLAPNLLAVYLTRSDVSKADFLFYLLILTIPYIVLVIVSTMTAADTYFYEQCVEARPFLPFMKRRILYYDKIHLHTMKSNDTPRIVNLSYYETPPKFRKSLPTWSKTHSSDIVFVLDINDIDTNAKILEFLKIKVQSVNSFSRNNHAGKQYKAGYRNAMETSARTELPVDPCEEPVHEVVCHRFLLGFLISISLALVLDLGLLSVIIPCIVMPIIGTNIYFYEQYVEARPVLQFVKRRVLYYDKMHVHIMKNRFDTHYIVNLSYYETPPKFWKSPYAWLKASPSGAINFKLDVDGNTKILEFVKTKAKSVNSCD